MATFGRVRAYVVALTAQNAGLVAATFVVVPSGRAVFGAAFCAVVAVVGAGDTPKRVAVGRPVVAKRRGLVVAVARAGTRGAAVAAVDRGRRAAPPSVASATRAAGAVE